jgi:hypothetical protein
MAKVTKTKYTRDYREYNPPIELGPNTWILDTIVIPIVVKSDASSR